MLVDLDTLTIRTIAHEDLPELEWDGEYTHFRRLYAHAYQQQSKGDAVLWAAELPGAGIIGLSYN
jgi:hypothetical protein